MDAAQLEASSPPAGLIEVAGVAYGPNDLAIFLGRNALFDSEMEAQIALEKFVDYLVVRDAATRRSGAGAPRAPRALIEWIAEREVEVDSVSDSEARAFYTENRRRWVHPRQVRLEYFFTPRGGDPIASFRRVRSVRIRAQMSGAVTPLAALLVAEHPGELSGELQAVDCNAPRREPELAGDALPLNAIDHACASRRGALSNPIDVKGGWYLVRKLGEIPARQASFERLQDEIREELREAAQQRAYRKARDLIYAEAGVKPSLDALARLVSPSQEIDHQGPALPPGGTASDPMRGHPRNAEHRSNG